MNTNPTTLILSAELDSLDSFYNGIRTTQLIDLMNDLGLDFKSVLGCYRYDSGVIANEVSFVVPVNDQALRESLVGIMLERFGQESVLELSPSRKAFLLRKDSEEFIGDWKEVSKEVAHSGDAFTFDQSTGKYYVVE